MPSIDREMLAKAFPGQIRTQRAFELQAQSVDKIAEATALNVEATQALTDATVVTLSRNEALANERVLVIGVGLIAQDADGNLTIAINDKDVPLTNQRRVTFIAPSDVTLFLPFNGTLATLAGVETFSNKTLASPKASGLGNHVDDTAAAAGGVPVGGLYRNGSALMVRVT